MEILKRGVDPLTKTYDGKCVNCQTEVRFIKAEAKEEFDRMIRLLSVTCPVCKQQITVTA